MTVFERYNSYSTSILLRMVICQKFFNSLDSYSQDLIKSILQDRYHCDFLFS